LVAFAQYHQLGGDGPDINAQIVCHHVNPETQSSKSLHLPAGRQVQANVKSGPNCKCQKKIKIFEI
jgi:hypothetical protein